MITHSSASLPCSPFLPIPIAFHIFCYFVLPLDWVVAGRYTARLIGPPGSWDVRTYVHMGVCYRDVKYPKLLNPAKYQPNIYPPVTRIPYPLLSHVPQDPSLIKHRPILLYVRVISHKYLLHGIRLGHEPNLRLRYPERMDSNFYR